jgi:site-specific recombinase XerD
VLLKNDTHLKVVQERLGHASIATTGNIYSHVAPSMQAGAAETFAAAMDAEGL